MIHKIGLIGVGYWGPNIANSFSFIKKAHLKWVCDLNIEKARRVAEKYCSGFTNDYHQVINDPEIESVIIATPVESHFQIACDALQRGKHILIEKPITKTAAEALELIKMAHESRSILMVGHVFLYNNAIRELKNLIMSGSIGDIHYLHFERTNLGPVRVDVNSLWDLASHDISIMIYLLEQMPLRVSALGKSYLNQGVEDVIFANYVFKNNILVNIHVSWLNPLKVRNIIVIGSEKMIIWNDLDLNAPLKIFNKRVERSIEPDNFFAYKTAVVDGGITIPRVALNQPLLTECEHFLDCIENGTTPLSDGKNALDVIKLLEATTKSMTENSQLIEIAF